MEENIFKEEIKQENEEFVDDSNPRPTAIGVSAMQLHNFSEKIAPDWKKLAIKLGIYNFFFFTTDLFYKPADL